MAAISENQKVRIVPINLFTDGTSSNSSKKWNKIDSRSLVPAALSPEERNKRESFHSTCVHNRLTALEMLPNIVRDLKQLAGGIQMYDGTSQPMVVVFAPLHFISADNPRHAATACVKGSPHDLPLQKMLLQGEESK